MREPAELGSWLCLWNEEEQPSCLLCVLEKTVINQATILVMYI